ncbi:Protein kish-B [Trichinella pseudospiralis]|uniref:Protein kish-B n=1 Tax=Trichinella pseudospiralis TaxID=6337 RepID=A0A0V1G368_TRIPS|nr:Protein kish-B [Trichinella pseudospiralis]
MRHRQKCVRIIHCITNYCIMIGMNVYSYDGAFVVILLAVCSCAYFRRIPRLKKWFFSDKSGIWGVCYKASVIGIRLHALLYFCFTMVQHKVKQKISLPANAKSKSDRHRQRKVKNKGGMKKGKWIIKPKNSKDLKHFKKEMAISKVINEENEELITARAFLLSEFQEKLHSKSQ